MSVEHEDGQTRNSIFPCQQHYPTENRTQQNILSCAYYNLPLRRFKQIVLLHFQVHFRLFSQQVNPTKTN